MSRLDDCKFNYRREKIVNLKLKEKLNFEFLFREYKVNFSFWHDKNQNTIKKLTLDIYIPDEYFIVGGRDELLVVVGEAHGGHGVRVLRVVLERGLIVVFELQEARLRADGHQVEAIRQ